MRTIVLLVVAALLVAVLAVHAQSSFVYHRQTAEAVLRDYARLAAGELIRRITVEVGYNGYFPLVTSLRNRRADAPLPTSEDIRAALDGKHLPAAALVRTVFRLEPGTGRLETGGGPLARASRDWLRARLARGDVTGTAAPYAVLHYRDEVTTNSFVVFGAADGPEAPVVGFAVDNDALVALFRKAHDSGPLLPPSLGEGEVGNEMLYVAVQDALQRPLFQTGGYATPSLTTTVPFGDTYNGILDGMSVVTSINPASAPGLVIGGLPRSRLPFLMGLLLLTLALLAAAIVQLRRERKLARLRSDFVAQVSHELRTPLAQIRIFTETLLLGRVRSEDERRRALEVLDREARRLCHLVENTLQFSRSERGGMPMTPRSLSPATLIREVVEGFQPLGKTNRVRFVLDLDDSLRCKLDDEATRQVIINLLDNALKYGPVGQEVRVRLLKNGVRARITIEDQGPGVPAEDRQKIWERFHRLDRDREAAVAGAGIGLTVVSDLVLRQGGRVWVEDADDGGARFCVDLPSALDEPAEGDPARSPKATAGMDQPAPADVPAVAPARARDARRRGEPGTRGGVSPGSPAKAGELP